MKIKGQEILSKLKKLDVSKILKNKKFLAAMICATIALPTVTTAYALETLRVGWHGEGAEKYYVNEDRERATGWLELDEGTYFFDAEGNMTFGWLELDGVKYYMDLTTGLKVSGEQEIDGKTYHFQEDGKLFVGWNKEMTSFYTELGVALNGWQDIDGYTYYFQDGTIIADGFQKLEGKTYFFSNGIKQDGTVTYEGKTYYLDGGVFYNGFSEKNGYKSYHDATGKQLFGWQVINGKKYYFDKETGVMWVNTELDGYNIDKYGVATKEKKEVATKKATSTNSGSKKPSNSGNGNAALNPSGNAIAGAALSQLGVRQDCTRLVTNSLAAVGIYFHSAPHGYLSLGTIVSNPQPGDIIVYNDGGIGMPHVAIYIGNGQAVHGGWLGTTAIASANVGSGPIYVRVR